MSVVEVTAAVQPAESGPEPAAEPERRVRLGGVTTESLATFAGAVAGSLGTTWLLFDRIMPFTGGMGFFLLWYLLFLAFYWGIARLQWDARHVREKLVSAALTAAGLLVVGRGIL